MIKQLTNENVQELIESSKASYILFYNDNIPLIERIKDLFKEFDKRLKGKVDIIFCNLEKEEKVSDYFQMSILPAVLFLKKSTIYGNLAGPVPLKKYEDILKEALNRLVNEQHNQNI